MPMITLVMCVTVLLFNAGCSTGAGTANELRTVTFRVVAESDGTTLGSRELQFFDARFEDVVFEFAKTKASNQKHYLGTVVTDTNGCFALDLSDPKMPEEIVIQPGPPFGVVSVERASDIGHTKSAFHIRVVRFKKGTREVVRNDIYDLKGKTVKQIAFNGKETETAFREVLLVVQETAEKAQPLSAN